MGSCVSSTCDECNKKELERQEEMPCPYISKSLDNSDLISIYLENYEPVECIICYNLLERVDARPLNCEINNCKIRCHVDCLYKWFKNHRKCPICDFTWKRPPEIFFPKRDEIPITIRRIKKNMQNLEFVT